MTDFFCLPIFVHQIFKLLVKAIKRETGKGGGMNFLFSGRGLEILHWDMEGLKFSKKVLESLP